jgi:prepilin-type processing-associated H-X9-DG protein
MVAWQGGSAFPRQGVRAAACDYVAVAGMIGSPESPDASVGAWGASLWNGYELAFEAYRRPSSLRDISDGLSHTLLLVERSGWPTWYGTHRDLAEPPHQFSDYGAWVPADVLTDWLVPHTRVNEHNAYGLYSFHSGGAHVAMCDGSIHFLSEHVSFDVLAALVTREGGEPIRDEGWR